MQKVTTQTGLDAAIAAGATEVELSGAREFDVRCDIALHIRGDSNLDIWTLGDSRPHILTYGDSRPDIRTLGDSRPVIMAYGDSRPVIRTCGESRPDILTLGDSKAVVHARGNSVVTVTQYGTFAPKIIIELDSTAAVNFLDKKTPKTEAKMRTNQTGLADAQYAYDHAKTSEDEGVQPLLDSIESHPAWRDITDVVSSVAGGKIAIAATADHAPSGRADRAGIITTTLSVEYDFESPDHDSADEIVAILLDQLASVLRSPLRTVLAHDS